MMVAGLAFHQLLQNPSGEGPGLDAYARLPEISSVPFLS